MMSKFIKFEGMEIEGNKKTFRLKFRGGQASFGREKAEQTIKVCPQSNMIEGIISDAWYIPFEGLVEIYDAVRKLIEAERIITNTQR